MIRAKTFGPRGPDVDLRFAVAGNQLGPAIAVEIVDHDVTQRPLRDQHVRRAGRRKPDAKNRRSMLVQPYSVIPTITVEVGHERRARGCSVRKQKETRTQTADQRDQPNQRTAQVLVKVTERGADAHSQSARHTVGLSSPARSDANNWSIKHRRSVIDYQCKY